MDFLTAWVCRAYEIEGKTVIKSVINYSRMSRDTYSEILDYILELLNTQKLYSLPLIGTTAKLKLS